MHIGRQILLLSVVVAQLQPLNCPEQSLLAISEVSFTPSSLQPGVSTVMKVKGENGSTTPLYITSARLVVFASDPAATILTDFEAATFNLPSQPHFQLKAKFTPQFAPGKASYTLQLFQGLNPVACFTDTLKDSGALLMLAGVLLGFLA